jgi:hypothetical protein
MLARKARWVSCGCSVRSRGFSMLLCEVSSGAICLFQFRSTSITRSLCVFDRLVTGCRAGMHNSTDQSRSVARIARAAACALALCAAALSTSDCSAIVDANKSDLGPLPVPCMVGKTVSCRCPDGTQSTQVCNQLARFDPCMCQGHGGAGQASAAGRSGAGGVAGRGGASGAAGRSGAGGMSGRAGSMGVAGRAGTIGAAGRAAAGRGAAGH